MAFIEEGSVEYVMINGKKVPVVKCETEVVLRNKETGYEYNSDKEAEDDIANTFWSTFKCSDDIDKSELKHWPFELVINIFFLSINWHL